MSFSGFFSSFGGAFGGALGGGIFSTIGRFAGSMLGKYLDESSHTPDEYFHYKKQLEFLFLTSNVLNKPIPLVFGKAKVYGHIIWAKPINEVENTSTNTQYFADSHYAKNIHHSISYLYYANFAMAICEGEIEKIEKVWANEELIDLSNYNYTLYVGSEDQNPDPLIQQEYGPKTCAFRGVAYIVFKDLPLGDFGNAIPQFSFEVVRKSYVPTVKTVEDLVRSMIIIPGSGEFVYDTKIQYKIYKTEDGAELDRQILNSHNHKGIANSVHSLDQLLSVCPNLESVGLVVCWFANSLNIRDCYILPAVEYQDANSSTSEEWRVGRFTRETAKLIGRDGMHPRYGGSVNDASLIRYLEELKKRNLQVMLYPMFFMDLHGKPWRGHLTGDAEHIEQFFNKDGGYNNFILHYANLTKNLVSSFVIGSELKKVTSIRDHSHNFPAVYELIKLASQVKNIVGNNVKVTYAADWSEYHHTEGGWFHLDPLWASPYIDFVGIDAYVPITFSANSHISDEEIVKGWHSGEGFDYYLDEEKNKIPLDANYAWKNFHHWWSNVHVNPDGSQTLWQPKMKKICFTEFGYPSIDKATNQPNVFFDPNCVDGGAPLYSNSATDFSIQRRAIKASIEYWQDDEMLEDMYLWTWDARPYPAWPHYSIWTDGYLWEKGHWVNNKFGLVSLASIVTSICKNAGILANQIDVKTLDIPVEGVIFNKNISAIDAINLLRCCYFFDMYQDQDKLIFLKRGLSSILHIDEQDLIKLATSKTKSSNSLQLYEVTSNQAMNQISIGFINENKKYNLDSAYINVDAQTDRKIHFLYLPILMSNIEAERISLMIISNSKVENKVLVFTLPVSYLHLNPCDILVLTIYNITYCVRIIDIELNIFTLKITALPEDTKVYFLPRARQPQTFEFSQPNEECLFLNLPQLPWLENKQNYVHLAYSSQASSNLYASLDNQTFDRILELNNHGVIGVVLSFENNPHADIYLIDHRSKFVIYSKQNLVSVSDGELFQKLNFAVIGGEIIRFQNVQKVSENTYEISKLIRGEMLTECCIHNHYNGEKFAIIGRNINSIKVDESLVERQLYFKINAETHMFQMTNNIKPLITKLTYTLEDDLLVLRWVMRSSIYDDWIRKQTSESEKYIVALTRNGCEIKLETHESGISVNLPTSFAPLINVAIYSYSSLELLFNFDIV
jgi:hypothetical protein